MSHKYAEIFFTNQVKRYQETYGSRKAYESLENSLKQNYRLGEHEERFITERDSFYMASVSETGWPYIQHRGGPKGFIRVLDNKTLGFADFAGNRQYISAGNFISNNRVSLFFMDYPGQRRLKLAGHIELVASNDWETLAKIEPENYAARIERVYLIHIEGYDWNCPRHITPRYTEQEIEAHFLGAEK